MNFWKKLQGKVQTSKFGSWINYHVTNFADQPIDYQDDHVIFRVQQKIEEGEENKARKEKAGDVIIRRMRINDEGVTILLEEADCKVYFFSFKDIQKFYYAPDNCFVVFQIFNRKFQEQDNFVVYTAKQGPAVRLAVNDYLERFSQNQNSNPSSQKIPPIKEKGEEPKTLQVSDSENSDENLIEF